MQFAMTVDAQFDARARRYALHRILFGVKLVAVDAFGAGDMHVVSPERFAQRRRLVTAHADAVFLIERLVVAAEIQDIRRIFPMVGRRLAMTVDAGDQFHAIGAEGAGMQTMYLFLRVLVALQTGAIGASLKFEVVFVGFPGLCILHHAEQAERNGRQHHSDMTHRNFHPYWGTPQSGVR